ncbi:MAG: corrinoid protein [Opitutales bacterium]
MSHHEDLKTAVINGKRKDVKRILPELVETGAKPVDILEQDLIPAMGVVGERFKRGEIFVPEMLVAARAMKEAMSILEPELIAAGVKPEFKAIIGTVEGDLHDIGKNLVATMWKGAGLEVVDLGVNVTPQAFVEACREHQPDIIGLSALLTTTMPAMRQTISTIREAGFENAKIMVGGAPITEAYAREIGADGFARDAASAVDAAMELLKK